MSHNWHYKLKFYIKRGTIEINPSFNRHLILSKLLNLYRKRPWPVREVPTVNHRYYHQTKWNKLESISLVVSISLNVIQYVRTVEFEVQSLTKRGAFSLITNSITVWLWPRVSIKFDSPWITLSGPSIVF